MGETEQLLLIIGIFFVYILATIGVYQVAEKNGRNFAAWFITSLFCSPIVVLIILMCIGETSEKRKEEIINEELLRKKIREGITCPNCHNPNAKDNKFCITCGANLGAEV
jgi:hypothetical protein